MVRANRTSTGERRSSFAVLLAVLLIGFLTVRPRAAEPLPALHVLFIGNSFTYYHDMPAMIAELAKAAGGRPLEFEMEVAGGYTLERHWQERRALAKLRSRRWDFVVLQDQSQAPLLNRAELVGYGRKFDAAIRKAGAKTILYETWAVQDRPQEQAAISKAYESLGRELKAEIAPVGNAWQAALQRDKKLVLHEDDRKHPNRTGSYLAACVLFATIYDRDPTGLPGKIGGLTDAEARPLQSAAWKAVAALGR